MLNCFAFFLLLGLLERLIQTGICSMLLQLNLHLIFFVVGTGCIWSWSIHDVSCRGWSAWCIFCSMDYNSMDSS